MRHNRKQRLFGSMLAAGLAVSVVMQGTAVTAHAEVIMNDIVPQGIATAIVAESSGTAASGNQNTASGAAAGKGSQIITAGSGNRGAGSGQSSGGQSSSSGQTGSNGQAGSNGQGGAGTVQAGSGQNGAVTVVTGITDPGSGAAGSGQGSAAAAGTVGQGSSTVAAGSGTAAAGSGTVAAGSGAGSRVVGPGAYGNIVTEGEKGAGMAEPILGGASLTMLNSQSESQMLSAILQTSQGNLIVVDGGLGEDGDYLRSQIQARGGHVSAWLLSHPHGDHVGALYKILQDEAAGISSGITIDGIYYSFADPDWYRVHDQPEQTMAVSIIGTFAGLPQTMLHQVGRGQTIQVDDVTITVMNDRYELSNDPGNNATIVYKVMVNGKSILFLGDMGEDGGNRLLAEVGAEALKSDIVQMAHHGQNGVSEAVYQAVNPSICLWPTPDWLWNSSGNRYKIQSTKGWMSKLNVQKHYCMKDGDQVIY